MSIVVGPLAPIVANGAAVPPITSPSSVVPLFVTASLTVDEPPLTGTTDHVPGAKVA